MIGDYLYVVNGETRRGVLSAGAFTYNGNDFGLTFAWQEFTPDNDTDDWERWGAAKLTIQTSSPKFNDLTWGRGSAKLSGEWVSEDAKPPAANRMSLVIERITPPEM